MIKIKVIDLLNKIANEEKIPHFKVGEIEYFLDDRIYLQEKEEGMKCEDARWFIDKAWLNTEVEIIEEDKKIKKIDANDSDWHYCYNSKKIWEEVVDNLEILRIKVNKIIDCLEEKE